MPRHWPALTPAAELLALQAWVKFCWRGSVRIRLADSRTSAAQWDRDNAEAMMGPSGIYHSGQWNAYWRIERAA